MGRTGSACERWRLVLRRQESGQDCRCRHERRTVRLGVRVNIPEPETPEQDERQWHNEYEEYARLADSREDLWICPYCGNEHASENGTGSDVVCCGEVGHAIQENDDGNDE